MCRSKYSLGDQTSETIDLALQCQLDGGGSGLWPWNYSKLGKESWPSVVLPQESLDIFIYLFVYYMLCIILGPTDEGRGVVQRKDKHSGILTKLLLSKFISPKISVRLQCLTWCKYLKKYM